jgi:hypothetical protein
MLGLEPSGRNSNPTAGRPVIPARGFLHPLKNWIRIVATKGREFAKREVYGFGSWLLGVFQNNLHALAIVGAQHTDCGFQFAEWHHVAHQRVQPNRSALHQRD